MAEYRSTKSGKGLSRSARLPAALCTCLTAAAACFGEQQESRPNISVYGLKAIGVSQQLAVSLQENLESNLVKYDAYDVVSRSDIDLILSETRLEQAGAACDEEECLVAAGNLLGIQKMITGTVSRVGQTYNLVLKLIDVRSGQLEASANERHWGSEDRLLDVSERLLDRLVLVREETDNDTLEPIEADTSDISLSPGKEDVVAVQDAPGDTVARKAQPSRLARRVGWGALTLLGALAMCILAFTLIDS
jgi:hypothetical protein